MGEEPVFRVLGPLEVWAGGARVPLFGPRQERLLAALLLDAGEPVPVDRLVDVVWAQRPPATARHQVQDLVGRLRRTLVAAGRPPGVITTVRRGYALRVAAGEVDLRRFEAGVREAGATMASDPAGAVATLRAALAWWRGPALAGLDTPALEPAAAAWDASRLDAWEECLRLELTLHRHEAVLGELTALAARHPGRESLAGLLMSALDAAGRTADALAVYQRLRERLADELGVDPSAALQERYTAILRGVSTPPASVVPAQLPQDVRDFAGRAGELRQLDAAPPCTVVEGPAGVGKTALAVHWAHRVRDRFPDGQLYVDLRGYAPGPPLPPISALARSLRALGVPTERVPVDLDEAAGLYRTVLAGKRVLILLDNAGHVDQVRPLLPGTGGCVVVVTSRHRLGGLVARDGARRLPLGVLTPDEARDLLARLLGADRVAARPNAAAELARLCGYLPLAVRIAAANLGTRPIDRYTAQLRAGDRLAALRVAGDERSAVRAAFDLSYRALPGPARTLFRLLGLVPGADVTVAAAAALAGTDVREALDRLAAAYLVDERTPGRYAMHDLVRVYAADRAQAEDRAADRDAAVRRLLAHYLHGADAAATVLYPQMLRLSRPESPDPCFADEAEASAWLDAERVNLVAATGHAATAGPHEYAWLLSDALRGYFWLRMESVDWQATARAGLAAAEAAREPRAQAAARFSLGGLAWRTGRHGRAIGEFTRALSLAEDTGWVEGQAAMLGNLGGVCLNAGRLDDAVVHLSGALALNERTGRVGGQASNLVNLGVVAQEQGRLADSASHFREARELYRGIGARSGEALALANLGDVSRLAGRLDDSREHLAAALDLHGAIGNRGSEADALRCLAEVHRDAGHLAAALELAQDAVNLTREAGLRHLAAAALRAVASIHHRAGRYAAAVDGYRQALRSARDSGNHYTETEALVGLAAAEHEWGRASGLADRAPVVVAEAIALARRYGYRILLGEGLRVRSGLLLSRGDPDGAAEDARQALSIQRATGYRLGEARALVVFGQTHGTATAPH
jgi:DNA-binding SARP family transcriptional activator/tetratricopeptide (TPR) repeat protein